MKYAVTALIGLVLLATAVHAMPTQDQIKKVEALVADLMRNDQEDVKRGKKTRTEVAESAMKLAEQADSEAAKLLLIKDAFDLYVRAGEFDKAVDTLKRLQSDVPDIPPAQMVKIIEASLRNVPRKNGGQLYQLLEEHKTRVRYMKESSTLASSVKQKPADGSLRTRLAEHYAYLGKWELALEHFAAGEGKAAQFAKSERDGEPPTDKMADFWWNYPNGKAKELEPGFRAHAAMLYKKAIDSGKISGLNKVQAERRIKEVEESDMPVLGHEPGRNLPPPRQGRGGKDLYMVVDLTKTGKAAISYLREAPKNGWSDEYKMNKIVLRRIDPGSFEYMPGKSFKITQPFYIGVFEVTQRQYALVAGSNPSNYRGDTLPVEKVTYNAIRGASNGAKWPASSAVDSSSFMGKLRAQTGLDFDLPTEAQWEYACRAGTKTNYYWGDSMNGDYAWYKDNSNGMTHSVGCKTANAWGLYDMSGNVWEWCLDWYSGSISYGADPKGPSSGSRRVFRGGSWYNEADGGTSFSRKERDPSGMTHTIGFRLVRTLSN